MIPICNLWSERHVEFNKTNSEEWPIGNSFEQENSRMGIEVCGIWVLWSLILVLFFWEPITLIVRWDFICKCGAGVSNVGIYLAYISLDLAWAEYSVRWEVLYGNRRMSFWEIESCNQEGMVHTTASLDAFDLSPIVIHFSLLRHRGIGLEI